MDRLAEDIARGPVGITGCLRMQEPILWDADSCSAVGLPAATPLIDPPPATTKYLPG
jgi:hypothetical protein